MLLVKTQFHNLPLCCESSSVFWPEYYTKMLSLKAATAVVIMRQPKRSQTLPILPLASKELCQGIDFGHTTLRPNAVFKPIAFPLPVKIAPRQRLALRRVWGITTRFSKGLSAGLAAAPRRWKQLFATVLTPSDEGTHT